MYSKRLKNSYLGKQVYSILLVMCVIIYFNDVVVAQIQTYPGQIFSVLDDQQRGKIGFSNLSVLKTDKQSKILKFVDNNGIVKNIEIDVKASEIRDMIAGDIDNDGDDEIVFITKEHIFVLEKENGQFIVDTNKTTHLYGPDRKGKPNVISPRIESAYVRPLSEELKEAGKIAIGDVNNDGKNEIVITKTFLHPHEFQTIIPQLICSNDIFQWQKDHFEVIDAIIAGDYNAGIYIIDIDKDGLNELIIGGSSVYIFKSVQQHEDYLVKDPGRWWYRALNGGFYIYGVIDFNNNGGDQRIAIKDIDNTSIMSYCTIWDIGKKYIKNIGKIRTFDFSPSLIKTGGKLVGNKKMFDIEGFSEISAAVNLPISKYKGGLPFVNLKSIVLGDIDNNGEVEVIANIVDQAQIYDLK